MVAPVNAEIVAKGDDGIVLEAVERYKACFDWQDLQDQNTREDIKFANGDSRNCWQWPTKIYQQRTGGDAELPCLTINNTRTHNDMIINEISQNGFTAKIRPTGGKASYKSAELMEALLRRTQDISRYSTHKRKVAEQQVDGGIGYMLIETAYISERSFDQDIYLRSARDPTAVYLDPWIKQSDGLDANFGFVFERMPRKEFDRKYPEWKGKIGSQPIDSSFLMWLNDKEIMLAKYYRKLGKKDTLIAFKADNGEWVEKLASEIKKESGKEIYDTLMEQIEDGTLDGKHRSILNNEVEWFLIAGDTIIERGKWAGKYIPICRCVGRELVIENTLDRKGHTRPLIDAQRMLNYNASTDVMVTALQPRAPWLAPARAVEGQEGWKTANIDNFAVLLYNDVDDEAPTELQKVPPPARLDPPRGNAGYQMAMQNAERQMMMISGQFQAQMGENDTQSAASGKAINERKQQGDIATYHFTEHQGDMERAIGIQLLDLYPKIYDTKRALHVLDETGKKFWIRIDPDMDDVTQELQELKSDEEAVQMAFNPSIGEYECVSDPGPDYATQRQEAWNAYSMILQQNQWVASVAADLLVKFGDFPGAEELRERLQKEIKAMKPYLFDNKAEPQVTALQQQNQRLTALNAELIQKLAGKDLQLRGKQELRDVEAFKAETDRMKMTIEALTKIMLTPQQRAQMEHEIALSSHNAAMDMIVQANAPQVENTGATQ